MNNKLIKSLLEMKVSGESAKLMILDPKSDPFWPSPARVRDAKWIAEIWRERVNRKTYDRGLHYILVSLGVECPWGRERRVHPTPLYMNVDSDFNKTVGAVRDARNWGLLPWDAIEDRKHVGLEKWVDYGSLPSNRELRSFEDFAGEVSYSLGVYIPEVEQVGEAGFDEDDFDEIAENIVDRALKENMTDLTPARYQPYYIAIVSEKSGLRSVVRDALYKLDYGFDFLNFEGQASTTAVRDFVQDRLIGNVPAEHPIREKKIRIFYISDYDYAGRTMPPAFIQKLFYHLWETGTKLDIKITPLALSKEIVEKYDLPPAPVPERSLGAKTLQDRWLKEFGKIVEVDSLIALHPSVLEKIIVEEMEKYIDKDLVKRIREKLDEVRNEARDAILEAVEEKRADWLEARAKLLRAINELNEAIRRRGINETLEKLKSEIEKLNEEHNIKELVGNYQATLKEIYVDYEAPNLDFTSNYEADEESDWLFDSTRDPVEQVKILREYRP